MGIPAALLGFIALLILLVLIGTFSVKRAPEGLRFFLTVVGITIIFISMLFVFVNIYDKVNAPIFFLLLFFLIVYGLFLIGKKF